jgi:hypothetical protein
MEREKHFWWQLVVRSTIAAIAGLFVWSLCEIRLGYLDMHRERYLLTHFARAITMGRMVFFLVPFGGYCAAAVWSRSKPIRSMIVVSEALRIVSIIWVLVGILAWEVQER